MTRNCANTQIKESDSGIGSTQGSVWVFREWLVLITDPSDSVFFIFFGPKSLKIKSPSHVQFLDSTPIYTDSPGLTNVQ